jgi:hypothetical protein
LSATNAGAVILRFPFAQLCVCRKLQFRTFPIGFLVRFLDVYDKISNGDRSYIPIEASAKLE